jgi:hypothetical protein
MADDDLKYPSPWTLVMPWRNPSLRSKINGYMCLAVMAIAILTVATGLPIMILLVTLGLFVLWIIFMIIMDQRHMRKIKTAFEADVARRWTDKLTSQGNDQ